jgi:hypothetical protein
MQLNQQQLEYLARLGRAPDGLMLKQLCRAWIDEANGHLRTKSGEHLTREQGRAVMLDELMRYLDGLPTTPPRDQSRARPLPSGPRE